MRLKKKREKEKIVRRRERKQEQEREAAVAAAAAAAKEGVGEWAGSCLAGQRLLLHAVNSAQCTHPVPAVGAAATAVIGSPAEGQSRRLVGRSAVAIATGQWQCSVRG